MIKGKRKLSKNIFYHECFLQIENVRITADLKMPLASRHIFAISITLCRSQQPLSALLELTTCYLVI